MKDDENKAVIFDMDGVIIDSGRLWKRAENVIFSSVGVKLSDELCEITETMTTAEVTKFWFDRQPWKGKSLIEVENAVIEYVAFLIKEEGQAIDGITEFVKKIKSYGYKIGLATNSPSILIPVVLKKLKLHNLFDATSSAEHELKGKPSPDVYLTVAEKLNAKPQNCIAIEDTHSGLLAAKKAGMKTIVIIKDEPIKNGLNLADFVLYEYDQFNFPFY